MLVRDVMTTDVAAIRQDATVKEAAGLLIERRISGLPVIDDDGRVVGVVSEADFVRAAGHTHAARVLFARLFTPGPADMRVRGAMVRDVMTAPPRTIAPDEPVSRAAALMGRWKVNRLPVVEDGRLVGIVSRADIVGLYTRDDAALLKTARQAIQEIPGVTVEDVRDGVATMSGSVEQKATAEAARFIVAQLPGIVAVDASALSWHRER